MSLEEQHRLLCEVLAKLVDVLDCDELSLLAHHCGVKISDFYGAPEQVQALDVIEWKRTAA